MAGRGRTRGRKLVAPTANMASTPVTLDNTTPASRQIPLLCSVCPETPKFSDVSHLLTHIASKGHLHHETQTKLRAHQDIAAALALQQYEQWYREFGIETLLVERLRAKQVKEAARGRRGPVPSLAGASRDSHRPRGATFDDFIKVEDDYYPDFPILPSLFSTDFDPEVAVEHVTGPDMMALKGQVWPGMGKMDLANDEMKRTRNQRKPKSVIERMRRASQGIEPTEVVMSTDLEVERTRGVYDKTSSPELEDAEPASEKKTRAKRKRPAPLTEISSNVPRGVGRSTSAKVAKPASKPRPSRGRNQGETSHMAYSFQPFAQSHQQLTDDDDTFLSTSWADEPSIRSAHTLGSFPYPTFPSAAHGDHRFALRDRHPIHSLNPFSLSSRGSPTSMTKQGGGKASGHGRMSTRAQHIVHNDFSAAGYSHPSTPLSPSGSRYQDHSRFPMMSDHHLHGQIHSPFQHQTDDQQRLKQEDFSFSDSPFRNSSSHSFMGFSGHNPLFAQDRGFMDHSSRTLPQATASPLGFLPINRDRARAQTGSYGESQPGSESRTVKVERNANLETDPCLEERDTFLGRSDWGNAGDPGDDTHGDHVTLDAEELGI